MPHLFSYRDAELYSHHTVDMTPSQADHTMHAHELMEVFFFMIRSAAVILRLHSGCGQLNKLVISYHPIAR